MVWVIGVVILAALGVCVWYFAKKGDEAKHGTDPLDPGKGHKGHGKP